MIANLTSDLRYYMADGENGLVCRDETCESLVDKLREAHELRANKSAYLNMREKALQSAKAHFDYRLYSKSIEQLIGSQ